MAKPRVRLSLCPLRGEKVAAGQMEGAWTTYLRTQVWL